MGRNVRINTCRGFVVVALTIVLAYVTVIGNTDRFNMFVPLYMLILNYMFGKDDGDGIK